MLKREEILKVVEEEATRRGREGSQSRAADRLGVSKQRVSQVVRFVPKVRVKKPIDPTKCTICRKEDPPPGYKTCATCREKLSASYKDLAAFAKDKSLTIREAKKIFVQPVKMRLANGPKRKNKTRLQERGLYSLGQQKLQDALKDVNKEDLARDLGYRSRDMVRWWCDGSIPCPTLRVAVEFEKRFG